MDLKDALSRLDPADDTHWTAEGLPLLFRLSELTGLPHTRKQVTDLAPEFTRDAAAKFAVLGDEGTAPQETASDNEPEIDPEQQQQQHQARPPVDAIVALEADLVQISREIAKLTEIRRGIEQQHARLIAIRDAGAPSGGDATMRGIQQYIAAQNRARQARAARVHGALNGAKGRDLLEALTTRSKLDAAMAHRKAGLGAARPAVRTPPATN